MNSASFMGVNDGAQIGINYGSINNHYVQKENNQQETDRGVLRSLSFPQMLDRRDNIAPAHTDTCRWILDLEDFKNWEIQSRGLLWIKGKPGAGKSTLMAFLYSQLNESQELRETTGSDGSIRLDFFFSARGTELQHTPLGMLRSLLNQLYDFDETVRPPVRKIFEDRCRQFGYGDSHWAWTQVKLEELLADAILQSAKQQQVVVFVDALDEAGAESARHVAAYFHRLTSRAERIEAAVKICISCRHYPIAEDAQTINIIVEAHNRDDIASYIENAFVGVAAGENQVELKGLMEHLIRQADGVFQWIHLLVPSIKRRIADCESFDGIYSWLREVPAGLEEVYVYIINNVIVEHNRKQSLLLFQLVCLAEKPLTVTQMRYALATENMQISLSQTSVPQILTSPKSLESTRHFIDNDDRMKIIIKALSGGLAEVVPSEHDLEIVQVVHQSVNDFLYENGFELLLCHTTAKGLSLHGGGIIQQCQATLYRLCLISVACYAQVWETMSDPVREPVHIASEIMTGNDTFFFYATVCLFSHAKKAAGSRLGIMKNEVDLLQSITEAWVQFQMRLYYGLGHRQFQHGTVLLHVAAAYDLVDIIEYILDRTQHTDTRDYLGNTALHLATQHGHKRASKLLCQRGASCEVKNDNGMTALTGAASHGDLELFQWLLHEEAGAGIYDNKHDELRAAAAEGHTQVVQILLDGHVDFNAHDSKVGNSLQAAAHGGHVEVVRMLLDIHADVNAEGGRYGKALHAAARGGNVEVVQMLLDSDINTDGGEYQKVLQSAAGGVHVEVMRMLLDRYADFNVQGREYGNSLQIAAFVGHVEVVRMLLDANADVNAQDRVYGTSLQAAASTGKIEVVQMLLDAYADVNADADVDSRKKDYRNALQAAAGAGSEHAEVVHMLIAAHADVNAQGGRYGNALQTAAFRGNAEAVRMLIAAHADINAQGGQYGNALQAATVHGQIGIVHMLLEAHADVNAQGGQHGNALQAATLHGEIDIVRILLDAHADVNAQGGQYGNALQAATVKGKIDIVHILLDAHADVNAQGGRYGNALQGAIVKGKIDIVRILLDAHADVNAQGGKYGDALQAATLEGQIDIMRILIDAHADINAQCGKYQSAILAALSPGYPDNVQFPLDAGAYLPPVDKLDQNPLHIAVAVLDSQFIDELSHPKALSKMRNVITHFPFLTLALDNRDKLLRSPLHAAIYRTFTTSYAIKLLQLGADPSILDGYGRNIVDWIQGNRYWMGRIRPHCPQTLPTPHETQYLTVCQSVLILAEIISHSLPNLQWPLVQQLGHFLLSLNDEDRATYLFQLHMCPETGLFRMECFRCDSWIYGPAFVCRKCPNVVICSSCVSFGIEIELHTLEHETLEISSVPDKQQGFRSTSEEVCLFLQDLMEEYRAKMAEERIKRLLKDPLPSTAQEKTALSSSMSIFGPAIIPYSVLFGTFIVLFGYWYF